MRHRVRISLAAIMIAVSVGTVAATGQDAPQRPPGAAPADRVAPLDPAVDAILTRLENRKVHDLRAKVVWELSYALEEDSDAQRKIGTIWYKEDQPVPKFKVHFDKKIVGSSKRDLDEEHLFDGRWYVELNSQTKTVSRREIRREGDRTNPYRLGEGPFPVPFGQSKADIVREFDVTLVKPKPTDPPNTDHLKLVPRPGTISDREYKWLNFWISNKGDHAGLPEKVEVPKKDGTGAVNQYLTITFTKIELNTGFARNVFEIKTPGGYEEVEERLAPPPTQIKIEHGKANP